MERVESSPWSTLFRLVVAFALAGGLAGCEQPETSMEYQGREGREKVGQPIEVTDIELGKAIDAKKTITEPTRVFHPDDTVYVSVRMEGAADDAWLTTRWFHEREQIHRARHRSSPDGVGITEMHLDPPQVLATGRYTVEVRLNGKIVEARQFMVVPPDEEIEGT